MCPTAKVVPKTWSKMVYWACVLMILSLTLGLCSLFKTLIWCIILECLWYSWHKVDRRFGIYFILLDSCSNSAGRATLYFLLAKWALQVWIHMQIWSPNWDYEIQSISLVSYRYACCSISSWVFASYPGSFIHVFRTIQKGILFS